MITCDFLFSYCSNISSMSSSLDSFACSFSINPISTQNCLNSVSSKTDSIICSNEYSWLMDMFCSISFPRCSYLKGFSSFNCCYVGQGKCSQSRHIPFERHHLNVLNSITMQLNHVLRIREVACKLCKTKK